MRTILRFIILILIVFFYSCEDVIDIDIETAAGDLVVDAWIDNRSQEQFIRLTLSQEYFNNANPTTVTNATVTTTNLTTGKISNFTYSGDSGKYAWTPPTDQSIGDIGDQIDLSIEYDGVEYVASSVINRVPNIDSIGQEFETDEVFLDDGIYVQFYARDFEGAGDAYWIKSFKNDEYLNDGADLNIAYDAGFDSGSQIDGIVFISPIREFINAKDEDGLDIPWEVGENIKVEIHSISIGAFNFLEIARDQINNGDNGIFSLPLANARSNISDSNGNSALGYFNVAAVSISERNID